MPAAITTPIQQVGAPLGSLLLSAVAQEWSGVVTNRLWGYVDFYALDASNIPFGFQYALTSGGTYTVVPAGGIVTLPFFETQSYFFIWLVSAATIYGVTAG